MKILIVSLPDTYNGLDLSGHDVTYHTEGVHLPSANNYVASIADEYDLVINNVPSIETPSNGIGNTSASANLELCKWATRQKAEELGFLLPTVLEECTLNTVSTSHTNTVFLKPKDSSLHRWHTCWKIPAGTDIENHNNNFPPNVPAYVEEDIQHDIEGGCIFTMREGSYTIVKTQGYTSRGDEKLFSGATPWKDGGVGDLTSSQETLLIDACSTWLDYAATLGGTYEGEICVGIKGTDLYWFEQNSRRGTFGSLTGSGQDWLDSLRLDVTKASSISWDFNF